MSTDAETVPVEEGRTLVSAATETGSVETRPMGEVRRRELALLVEQAQAGSRSALDEIVDRLMPLVWQVVLCQGADRDTAMDAVQSTWLTLVEHLDELRTPAALAAWLVTVARREARRAVRLKRRTYVVEPDVAAQEPDPAGDISERIANNEQYDRLWQHLRGLSPRCQELLRIVAFADRPNYAAISATLGMPKGSIGPVRGRCLARLRRLLERDPAWSLP